MSFLITFPDRSNDWMVSNWLARWMFDLLRDQVGDPLLIDYLDMVQSIGGIRVVDIPEQHVDPLLDCLIRTGDNIARGKHAVARDGEPQPQLQSHCEGLFAELRDSLRDWHAGSRAET